MATELQLCERTNDGLKIELLFLPLCERTVVRVTDIFTEDYAQVPVRDDRALDAFNHPFVYGAVDPRGMVTEITDEDDEYETA